MADQHSGGEPQGGRESGRDWSARFAEEVEDLRRVRDELRVQIHLGRREARERWEELEERWEHLEGRLRELRRETRESLEDVAGAARHLVDEIRRGYRRLRERI